MALTGNTPLITQIQTLDCSAVGGVGGPNAGFSVDWDRGFVFVENTNTAIRRLRMDNFSQTFATLTLIDDQMVCDLDGNVWTYANGFKWRKINPTTLAEVGFIPSSDGDLATSHVCLKVGGVNLMVAGHTVFGAKIRVWNLDALTQSAQGAYFPSEGGECKVCRSGTHPDTAYFYSSSSGTQPLGIYKIVVRADATYTVTKLGVVNSTQVDPTWHYWNINGGFKGILADEQNDDIIIGHANAQTVGWGSGNSYSLGDVIQDGVRDYKSLSSGNVGHVPSTSPTFWQDLGPRYAPTGSGIEGRVFKVKIADLSVPWSVQAGTGTNLFNASRIRFSRLCFIDSGSEMDGSRVFHSLNTITGAETRQFIHGVLSDAQVYNDLTGNLYSFITYTDLPGDPLCPHPHAPTAASFASWATLGGFPQPAAPPPSNPIYKQASVFG